MKVRKLRVRVNKRFYLDKLKDATWFLEAMQHYQKCLNRNVLDASASSNHKYCEWYLKKYYPVLSAKFLILI